MCRVQIPLFSLEGILIAMHHAYSLIGMSKDEGRNVSNTATNSKFPTKTSWASSQYEAPRKTGLRAANSKSCAVVNVVHPTLKYHPAFSS